MGHSTIVIWVVQPVPVSIPVAIPVAVNPAGNFSQLIKSKSPPLQVSKQVY